MTRHFTLDEATELLPFLKETMREALDARAVLESAEGALRELAGRVAMSGGMLAKPELFLEERARRETAARILKESIQKIHERGVQVKDLDTGLVDFPSRYRGRTVLLCWKLGEAEIAYWHGESEGFAGRKEIDRDFLENHRGD